MARGWRAVILLLGAGCGGDTAGLEAFCDAARDVFGASATSAEDPEGFPDALKEIRDEAPDEIAAEINLTVDVTEEAIATADFWGFESDEFTAADAKITSYMNANCEAPED